MKYLLVLILLLACGQESGVHTFGGPEGPQGEAGSAAKPCHTYCDGRSHVVVSCPASAVTFKVKNCKEL